MIDCFSTKYKKNSRPFSARILVGDAATAIAQEQSISLDEVH
jgi:hypothetical protein